MRKVYLKCSFALLFPHPPFPEPILLLLVSQGWKGGQEEKDQRKIQFYLLVFLDSDCWFSPPGADVTFPVWPLIASPFLLSRWFTFCWDPHSPSGSHSFQIMFIQDGSYQVMFCHVHLAHERFLYIFAYLLTSNLVNADQLQLFYSKGYASSRGQI